MKKHFLTSLIFAVSIFSLNAQTWSGNTPGKIYYNLGNVGIGEVNSAISLNLYPNPASQTIAIATSEVLTGVEVYNVMGQKVVSMVGNVTQLDVTTLPAGTYYLNAITEKGTARKPFVKF